MKAICLISGGLDSILAAKTILGQGVDIIGLNCKSQFCPRSKHKVEDMAKNLAIEFKGIDVTIDMLEIIKSPKHGFGSNINPCIDCKIMMLKKAKELMNILEASFIVTGEVLGQRPMSQQRYTMSMIEKEAGLKGLIVRPLSAKLLDETIPEKNKWINRDALFSISGRGRKEQIMLAEKLDIREYSWPAGGCLLTDPAFSKRLRDLIKNNPSPSPEDIELLKVGRHFRISNDAKLIVGRNEKENKQLLDFAKKDDFTFETVYVPGPVGLLIGSSLTDDILELSASIITYYSDLKEKSTKILVKNTYQNKEGLVEACPIFKEQIQIKII
ncbi:MAG: tRNA 4-thiouridine(8) synthase ThiI [Candidatus Omnitrophota bacterium]